jgi:hypothetical protein
MANDDDLRKSMSPDDRRRAERTRELEEQERQIAERTAQILALHGPRLEQWAAVLAPDNPEIHQSAAGFLARHMAENNLKIDEVGARTVQDADAIGKAYAAERQQQAEQEARAAAELDRLAAAKRDGEQLQREAEAEAAKVQELERQHEANRNEPIPGSVQPFIDAIARAEDDRNVLAEYERYKAELKIARADIDPEFDSPLWAAQAATAERSQRQLGHYDALNNSATGSENPADLRSPFPQFDMPENSAAAFIAAIATTQTIEPSRSDLSLTETGEQDRPFGLMENFVTAETKKEVAAEVRERETIQQQFGRAAAGLTR